MEEPQSKSERSRAPRAAAVLVAAGESTRMRAASGGVRKPLLELQGRPLLEHTCAAFDAATSVQAIVIVAHRDDVAALQQLAVERTALRKVVCVVPGGARRTDSVRAGVEAVPADCEIVLVHDAARPLVSPQTIEAAAALAAREGAALVAMPVSDTLKLSNDGLRAQSTVDREHIWAAQTPQAFRTTLLRELLERARRDHFTPTDDAALYERYVGPIPLVRGERGNIKVTVPEDLAIAEALLALRAARAHKEPNT